MFQLKSLTLGIKLHLSIFPMPCCVLLVNKGWNKRLCAPSKGRRERQRGRGGKRGRRKSYGWNAKWRKWLCAAPWGLAKQNSGKERSRIGRSLIKRDANYCYARQLITWHCWIIYWEGLSTACQHSPYWKNEKEKISVLMPSGGFVQWWYVSRHSSQVGHERKYTSLCCEHYSQLLWEEQMELVRYLTHCRAHKSFTY